MSASLVGSEMCIRDRVWGRELEVVKGRQLEEDAKTCSLDQFLPGDFPVSYTHLTLPTICSV
eukprot:5154258-Alexandrium_andersonii.AAC.1